jgi:spore coat protein U-like protein
MNAELLRHRTPLWRALRVIGAALPLAWVTPAHAAPGDTATAAGQASVLVIKPLTLAKARDIDFGRIGATTSAGTVTVAPANGMCSKNGPILQFGACTSAEFVGMGQQNALVSIDLPANVALTGPGAPMTMNNLRLDTAPDLGGIILPLIGLYRIIPANGIFDFRVGGTLGVGANQLPGRYNGTFQVTVNYY